MNNKKYKLGLHGELISESLINRLIENNGFDFEAASSSAPASSKTATVQETPKKSESTGKYNEKDITELTTKLKKEATAVDSNLKLIYSGLEGIFKNRSFWSGYTGYFDDDELGARAGVFGVTTAGAHPTAEEIKSGFSSGIGWWGETAYPAYKKANQQVTNINQMINSFVKNKGIADEDLYSEHPELSDLKEQANINIAQVYKIFSEVVDKINRSYVSASTNKQKVRITYIHLLNKIDPMVTGPSLGAKSSSYSFSTDF